MEVIKFISKELLDECIAGIIMLVIGFVLFGNHHTLFSDVYDTVFSIAEVFFRVTLRPKYLQS